MFFKLQHPLNQGLKHGIRRSTEWKLFDFKLQHPLNQGLKLIMK